MASRDPYGSPIEDFLAFFKRTIGKFIKKNCAREMAPVVIFVGIYFFELHNFFSAPSTAFVDFMMCPIGCLAPFFVFYGFCATLVDYKKLNLRDWLFRIPLFLFAFAVTVVNWHPTLREETRSHLWKWRVIQHCGSLEELRGRVLAEIAERQSKGQITAGHNEFEQGYHQWTAGPLKPDLVKLAPNYVGMLNDSLRYPEEPDVTYMKFNYAGGHNTDIGFVVGPPEMKMEGMDEWAPGIYFFNTMRGIL